MEIEYYIKETYGTARIYIKNPTHRNYITKITRQTTISDQIMSALSGLTNHWITFKQVLP